MRKFQDGFDCNDILIISIGLLLDKGTKEGCGIPGANWGMYSLRSGITLNRY